MRVTYCDVNEMLFAIANDLDGVLIFLLVECLELAFFCQSLRELTMT